MRAKLIIFFSLIALVSNGQLNSLSPYSLFGIGDLYRTGSVATHGLGGVSSTWNDPYILNPENPSTLGSLFNTNFQTGLRLQSLRITEGDQSQTLNAGNIDQFNFAFKKAKSNTGYLFGLSPFSTSGYSITKQEEIDGVGNAAFKYDGSGGISKIYLGAGHKVDMYKYHYFNDKNGNVYDSLRVVQRSISFGGKVNYVFGNIKNIRAIDIADVTFVDTRNTKTTRIYDFLFDLGVHYEQDLRTRYGSDKRLNSRTFIQLGAVYTPKMKMQIELNELVESTVTSSGVVLPVDSSSNVTSTGSFMMPQNLKFGAALHHHNKNGRQFALAVDVNQRNWSELNNSDVQLTGQLKDTREYSLGFQFTPKPIEDAKNMLSRSNYRLGARLTPTYVTVQDEQITEQAISAGLTIPLLSSRSASKIHFGMEIGHRGKNEGNMIREDFTNFYIGFSLSPFYKNAWFVQRKYE
jgi:hypothetical protein